VGQERVVDKLRSVVRVTGKCNEPVPHMLLCGPPGLGKTTLALAVANEAGAGLKRVSAPTIEEPKGLLRLLTSLADRDVLFIDEIHRLPARVIESFYEAMDEGAMSLQVTCGDRVKCLHVQTPRFTMIGATTDEDRLPDALLSRFRIRQRLEFYGRDELAELVSRAASGNCRPIDAEAAGYLAEFSRNTPREALALLDAARHEAIDADDPAIGREHVARALARLGVDEDGLIPLERSYLEILAVSRGPVGQATLAGRLGVSKRTLRRYEQFLLRRGLVAITRRGRALAG
jgi:Holliday junction DNA helicase RuvB